MLPTLLFHFLALPYYCNVSHNFTTTVIVTIILNQKKNRPWYSPLIDCWVRIVLLLVFMNDCVAFCHSKAFLSNFIAVTAG
mmetsp:Transcript_35420/g.40680  ORF Transcript_35420/g.40680 Transcript_35420/m.40680 type:complete len:81 (+) Transcript_35420:505-747(+)